MYLCVCAVVWFSPAKRCQCFGGFSHLRIALGLSRQGTSPESVCQSYSTHHRTPIRVRFAPFPADHFDELNARQQQQQRARAEKLTTQVCLDNRHSRSRGKAIVAAKPARMHEELNELRNRWKLAIVVKFYILRML